MAKIFDDNAIMDRAAQNIAKAKDHIRNRKPTEAFSALWSAELFYQLAGVSLISGNAYYDHLQVLQNDVKTQMQPNYTVDQF